MNNYWYTNYKADQEGVATFNYSLKPHKRYDQAFANRQALGFSQPLLVCGDKPVFTPPFALQDSSILLTSARPSMDGKGVVVRFYNASAGACRLGLRWKDGIQRKVYLVDEGENKLRVFDLHSLWPANSIRTLLIE
jgi:hypothetical protein